MFNPKKNRFQTDLHKIFIQQNFKVKKILGLKNV